MTHPEVSEQDDRDGRKQAAASLYREHGRSLWAIFYSQCSDSERAHDAVQEAFLKFCLYSGEPIRDPRAWLMRVGQNWLRDAARKKSNSCQLMPGMDNMAGRGVPAEGSLLAFEQHTEIRDALRLLNEDDRKVLVMKYALDWSTAQIATAMNSGTPAVDMRLTRARRRLAEILVERGFKYP
jgi:RNA polymerase sigma factor (sigma-70 family)